MADCRLGRAEQALSTLHKMIPDSKDNPVSITGAEPYLFVNCWCMHPSFFTRIWFGWFTGTSAWALRGFYEGICGLRREYGGLRVQPLHSRAWKELTLTRAFPRLPVSHSYFQHRKREAGGHSRRKPACRYSPARSERRTDTRSGCTDMIRGQTPCRSVS